MANPYESYEKTGLDKMIKLAKVLCRLVLTFEVIIRAKFPDSVPIIALLEAIKQLCVLVPDADADFQAYILDTTPPPADAGEAAGINPDAPAAQPPDLT